MTKILDQARSDITAQFIADQLMVLLDRKADLSSGRGQIFRECPTYNDGLTNGEICLATLKALNMVALRVAYDLEQLERDVSA
ncbi:hypothetical protein ACVI1L_008496 [Bradyrhizobium sp. USDA 4516]